MVRQLKGRWSLPAPLHHYKLTPEEGYPISVSVQSLILSLRIRTDSNKQHREAQPLERISFSESLLFMPPETHRDLSPRSGISEALAGVGGRGLKKQTPRDLFLLP